MAEVEAVTAARCRSCDAAPPDPGNRFCVRCGGPLDDPALPMTDTVSRGRPGVGRWIAALGAVATIAVGTWALGRGGAADGADAGPATTPTTSTTERSTTTSRPARSTTSTTRPTTTTRDIVPGDGPVLDRPVGWSLVIGGWNSTGLLRLDLDTGQMERFDLEVVPHAAVDDWLVAQQEGVNQTYVLLSLEDPLADAVTTMGDDRWWSQAEAYVDAGAFWVPGEEDGGLVWRLIQPIGQTVVERVAIGRLGSAAIIWGTGPGLATTVAGGVYSLGDDGRYRLLAPGYPLIAGRDHVLVRRCGSPTDCSLVWLRRDTGEAVDRPVPADLMWAGTLSPDGRFLAYEDGTTDADGRPRGHLFDVERGREVDWFAPQSYAPVAFSPDGRFLAYDADGTIRLYDVERDVHLDLGSTTATYVSDRDARVVVFVPTPPAVPSTDPAASYSSAVPGRFGDK